MTSLQWFGNIFNSAKKLNTCFLCTLTDGGFLTEMEHIFLSIPFYSPKSFPKSFAISTSHIQLVFLRTSHQPCWPPSAAPDSFTHFHHHSAPSTNNILPNPSRYFEPCTVQPVMSKHHPRNTVGLQNSAHKAPVTPNTCHIVVREIVRFAEGG